MQYLIRLKRLKWGAYIHGKACQGSSDADSPQGPSWRRAPGRPGSAPSATPVPPACRKRSRRRSPNPTRPVHQLLRGGGRSGSRRRRRSPKLARPRPASEEGSSRRAERPNRRLPHPRCRRWCRLRSGCGPCSRPWQRRPPRRRHPAPRPPEAQDTPQCLGHFAPATSSEPHVLLVVPPRGPTRRPLSHKGRRPPSNARVRPRRSSGCRAAAPRAAAIAPARPSPRGRSRRGRRCRPRPA
mmetsp:Transcript_20889/g.72040  ORF Transcript_20889/g.72040 Transcript_20889/m.72040 type:complete len:240 (-) Transcript_20889:863-1582(-)